jgi:hypothetical protein
MPVFGKTLFETVLDGLEEPTEEQEDETPSPVRGFNGGFVGRAWDAQTEAELDPSSLFEAFLPDPAIAEPAVTGPVVPNWAGRVSEAEIAEDLALKTCRTSNDLKERRRLFARDNHPDRIVVDYRQQATHRMMIANQLIDAALARLR